MLPTPGHTTGSVTYVIPVDRRLPLGRAFRWREYEVVVHDLPGHTLYQAAYEFTVDGVRVLATGDQQVGACWPGSRPTTRVRGPVRSFACGWRSPIRRARRRHQPTGAPSRSPRT